MFPADNWGVEINAYLARRYERIRRGRWKGLRIESLLNSMGYLSRQPYGPIGLNELEQTWDSIQVAAQ